MPRTHLLLPASLLLSCAPAGLDSGAAVPAAAPEARSEALPAGASAGWLETVQARIAADARSIVPENGAFVAALPAHRAVARFTDGGLVIGELDAAEPLELRFTSWGAAGAVRPVEPVTPALGDCLTELLPQGDCARQLEYAHEGVTAWWVGLDRGVEFGWTVAAPPAEGDGELVFEVEVSGADWLEATGDGAELVDATGETWTVSGALAWGADGAALPTWLAVDGDALVVRVETAGAVYPVTVDPVLSAPTTTLTLDPSPVSVSGVGDVNGDGYDDVITGVADRDYPGNAYIYHGSSSGVSSTASRTLSPGVWPSWDYFGYSASGAGDVNGDGYDDVIIGAPGYNSRSLVGVGAAYIHHGSPSGLSASASLTLIGGGATYDYFGWSVSTAGDVNDDGYDDIIIGARDQSSGALRRAGAVYIHHGSPSGVSPSASLTLTGSVAGDNFGWSVSDAGDVNGDGYDDVVIGAWGYFSGSAGAAYIHHGSASGVSSRASLTLTGGAADDRFGASVSGAGDVNGDGYGDIVIGAHGYLGFTGAAYIHHGSASGVSPSASLTLTGGAVDDWFGHSVCGAGDVNNDGYDDVIIGSPYVDSGSLIDTGAVTVYHGSSSGVSSSPARTMIGAEGRSRGERVSDAGDVNGDGYSDVILGSSGNPWGYLSEATIHHGCGDGDGDGACVGGDLSQPQDCDDADPTLGELRTVYADLDGDGLGTGASFEACVGTGLYADNADDCDDTDATSGALVSGYVDADGDGLGLLPLVAACAGMWPLADNANDCDDTDATSGALVSGYVDADGDGLGVLPLMAACAGTWSLSDNADDCDDADAGIGALVSGYVDADGDGLGVLPLTEACAGTWFASDNADDCDDMDAAVGASRRRWSDLDGDGFGHGRGWVMACPGVPDLAPNNQDCDDTRSDVNPEAPEVCDGGRTDEDCDGLTDDADPSVDPSTFAAVYPDVDGDGFGDASAEPGACEAPAGHVSDNTDCDDGDAGAHPTAEDVPGDGVDQDCDGVDAAEDPSDDAPAKSGCSTAPGAPLPWLAALLALPALTRRRRG